MHQGTSHSQPPPQLPGAEPRPTAGSGEKAPTWFKAGKKANGSPLWPRSSGIWLLTASTSLIFIFMLGFATSGTLTLESLGFLIALVSGATWFIYSLKAAAITAAGLVLGVIVLAVSEPDLNELLGTTAFVFVAALIVFTVCCYQAYPMETGIVLFILGAWFLIKFAAHHFEVRQERNRHQLAHDIVDAQNGNTAFWRP